MAGNGVLNDLNRYIRNLLSEFKTHKLQGNTITNYMRYICFAIYRDFHFESKMILLLSTMFNILSIRASRHQQ